MPREPFVSYAQNGEDVVLWRALGSVEGGTYVDVGAAHPVVDSVTLALYERGWRGVHVEPVQAYADQLREARPEDVVVPVVAGSAPGRLPFHVIPGTGLSSTDDEVAQQHRDAGYAVETVEVPVRTLDDILAEAFPEPRELQVLKIDVEGAEAAVLAGTDLDRWRPWVLVVEATAPDSRRPTHEAWESVVLDAGYRLRLFDGLSRFYVRGDKDEDLGPDLSYPACSLDGFVRYDLVRKEQERSALDEQVLTWRAEALARAAELSVLHSRGDSAAAQAALAENRLLQEEVVWLRGLNAELDSQVRAIGRSLSWKVTKPLRVGGYLQRRRAAGQA